MVHCSFDLVDQFVMRVPKQRVEGKYPEEDKTARICVSSSVKKALRAIPQSGMVMTYMRKLGLPIIVHAYYVRADNFYKPTVLEVPDVKWTDEYWLLCLPKSIYRRDYEITEFETSYITDLNGVEAEFVTDVHLRPVKFQDNMVNLCGVFHADYRKLPKGVTFRAFMANCGDDLLKITKRKVC